MKIEIEILHREPLRFAFLDRSRGCGRVGCCAVVRDDPISYEISHYRIINDSSPVPKLAISSGQISFFVGAVVIFAMIFLVCLAAFESLGGTLALAMALGASVSWAIVAKFLFSFLMKYGFIKSFEIYI